VVLEVRPAAAVRLPAAAVVEDPASGTPTVDAGRGLVTIAIDDSALAAKALRRLDRAKVALDELALGRRSLAEAFLSSRAAPRCPSPTRRSPYERQVRGSRRWPPVMPWS